MTTRTEKQRKLANEATSLIFDLQHGGDAFFGNEGVTFYAEGKTGDVVGYLIAKAGIAPAYSGDVTDPAEAVALTLGVKKENLPETVQKATNFLAMVSDDTKRAYARRVPRLIKALTAFAELLNTTTIEGSTRSNTPRSFDLTGVSL